MHFVQGTSNSWGEWRMAWLWILQSTSLLANTNKIQNTKLFNLTRVLEFNYFENQSNRKKWVEPLSWTGRSTAYESGGKDQRVERKKNRCAGSPFRDHSFDFVTQLYNWYKNSRKGPTNPIIRIRSWLEFLCCIRESISAVEIVGLQQTVWVLRSRVRITFVWSMIMT